MSDQPICLDCGQRHGAFEVCGSGSPSAAREAVPSAPEKKHETRSPDGDGLGAVAPTQARPEQKPSVPQRGAGHDNREAGSEPAESHTISAFGVFNEKGEFYGAYECEVRFPDGHGLHSEPITIVRAAALGAVETPQQPTPHVQALLDQAQNWSQRVFDYEVAGCSLTGFEAEAVDIIKGLAFCVQNEPAVAAPPAVPQEHERPFPDELRELNEWRHFRGFLQAHGMTTPTPSNASLPAVLPAPHLDVSKRLREKVRTMREGCRLSRQRMNSVPPVMSEIMLALVEALEQNADDLEAITALTASSDGKDA